MDFVSSAKESSVTGARVVSRRQTSWRYKYMYVMRRACRKSDGTLRLYTPVTTLRPSSLAARSRYTLRRRNRRFSRAPFILLSCATYHESYVGDIRTGLDLYTSQCDATLHTFKRYLSWVHGLIPAGPGHDDRHCVGRLFFKMSLEQLEHEFARSRRWQSRWVLMAFRKISVSKCVSFWAYPYYLNLLRVLVVTVLDAV